MTEGVPHSRNDEIIAAYRAGERQAAIAAKFGISASWVSQIIVRRGANRPQNHKRANSLRRPLRDRFEAKLVKGADTDCWLWNGAKDPRGYSLISVDCRSRYASHVSLHLSGRPRPPGLCALHKCDNPECVNPDHLWWGTKKENTQDALRKGRLDLHGLALAPTRLKAGFGE